MEAMPQFCQNVPSLSPTAFFSCAALLHGSPVRINQLFTPGLRWPPPAPARYCGTVKRGTDSDLDALPQHATAEVLIIGSMIIKTDGKHLKFSRKNIHKYSDDFHMQMIHFYKISKSQ